MKTLTILAAALLSTGCSALSGTTTVDFGMGTAQQLTGSSTKWEGDGPAVKIGVRRDFHRAPVACEIVHISNLLSGVPFNDSGESTVDYIGCNLSWTFNK